MRRGTDIELMRLLHGELPADQARELRARMERDPGLAAAYARLESAWRGLELPPAAPAPLGFGQRIVTRARREPRGTLSWAAAPGWVRATAAAALVAGVALGAGVGAWTGAGIEKSPAVDEAPVFAGSGESSEDSLQPDFAEVYWEALGELEGAGL